MTSSVPTNPLRPLGLGELLDRAVTLCVKYFVPFSLIYVVYAIPLGIVNYFLTRPWAALEQNVADQLRAPGGKLDTTALGAAFSAQPPDAIVWSLLSVFMGFFIAPLVTAALIDATAETYLGRSTTFARAYRVGLNRWLPMIGINVLYGICAVILYIIAVIVVLVIVLALAAITQASHSLGIVLDVIVGLVAAIVFFAAVTVALLALELSYFACIVEGASFLTAFTRGISRISNGIGLRRALIVGLAYLLVGFGIALVSSIGQAVVIGLLRSPVAGTVYTTIVTVATAAFLKAFLTIFYFDLRVREEGLDLQLAAQAALVAPAVPLDAR